MNESGLSTEEKDRLISQIKSQSYLKMILVQLGELFIIMLVSEAIKTMSKSWLIGFTEASGSFYLVKKGPTRLTHAFKITQKLDRIVLEAIALIMGIKVTVKKLILL